MQDLPIIQKTYDLIKWYVPILNQLPRNHKFMLGDRIIAGLYDLLEGVIQARYADEKLLQLKALNTRLDILRHQTQLLLDVCKAGKPIYDMGMPIAFADTSSIAGFSPHLQNRLL